MQARGPAPGGLHPSEGPEAGPHPSMLARSAPFLNTQHPHLPQQVLYAG